MTQSKHTPRIMGRTEWRMTENGVCICRNYYHSGEFTPSDGANHTQIHYQAVAFLAGMEAARV